MNFPTEVKKSFFSLRSAKLDLLDLNDLPKTPNPVNTTQGCVLVELWQEPEALSVVFTLRLMQPAYKQPKSTMNQII